MYNWICEKCGDVNWSNQNICKNTACKFVMHRAGDQIVTCAKCKKEPAGGSLYRKGRNTTFPLRRLSVERLFHSDFEVYGEAGQNFLKALKPYIGLYLCQACHPDTLGLKVDSGFKDWTEADPSVKNRVLENEKAYDRISKQIKESLSILRKENPELTREDELLIARKMIAKVKDDEFLTDELDWKLRRIVRGAVASRISFRKNIDHERLGEKLYRFWRIEEARQRHDMSYLRKVLRQEAKRAHEMGEAIQNDSRKGPDLFSTIGEIRDLMARKSDEIALKEYRIDNEAEIGEKLDDRVKVLGHRIERWAKAFTASHDPDFLDRLGPILTRLRTCFTQAVEVSQRFLSPVEVEAERAIVRRMQARFFTHYVPLLNAATQIITWGIKWDLWNGPEGKPGDNKDSCGFSYGTNTASESDRRSWGYLREFAPIDRDIERIGKTLLPAFHVPCNPDGSQPLGEVVYGLMPIRCEICRKFTQETELLKVPAAKGYKVLVVCPLCITPTPAESKEAVLERQKRLQAEWEEKRDAQYKAEQIRVSQLKMDFGKFRNFLLTTMRMAMDELGRLGIRYAAPIFRLSPMTDGKAELVIIACPKLGVSLPSGISMGGWTTKVVSVQPMFFRMAYICHYLLPEEMAQWRSAAKRLGHKLGLVGLSGLYHGYISDDHSVAKILGVKFPELGMGYWKGIWKLEGMKEVHVNFRLLVEDGDLWNFEPMYPYGKPSEKEVARLKAIKEEMKRRATEERKFWDPMRTRRKGGPSPKSQGKKTVRTPGVLQKVEQKMELLPSTMERLRKTYPEMAQMDVVPAYVVKEPETKDLSKFLMAAGPYRGDSYTHRPPLTEKDKRFYIEKSAQSIKDAEDTKAINKASEELWKKRDPKTFQKVRLKK